MDNLKYGVVLSGLLGLLGCFLPSSLWGVRSIDPVNTYLLIGAFAVGFVVPAIALVKAPILRWQALTAASAFLFILIKMRGLLRPFLTDGSIGARLLVIGPAVGLLFACLCLAKAKTAVD